MDKDKGTSEPTNRSDGSGKTDSSGKYSFDLVKARQLYDRGMRDIELQTQLGTTRNLIVQWRKDNGLPANRIVVWNEERARELHSNGATDAEIADELSKAGGVVSPQAVGSWRRKNRLTANNGHGGVGGESAGEQRKERAAKKMRTPDFEGGTRKGHLVALPSKQSNPASQVNGGSALRGMHQRRRSRADLPLPTTYDQGMDDISFFPELADIAGDAALESHEEEVLYMFTTILHLCRLDYGWTSDDVYDFLEAVQFAERVMSGLEAQDGRIGGEEEPDLFDWLPKMEMESPKKPAAGKSKQKKNTKKNTKTTKNTKK